MSNKRTLTVNEIARLLDHEPGDTISLEPFTIVKMAAPGVFQISRRGQKGTHFLREAPVSELAEISALLWEKLSPEFIGSNLEDDLMPDNLKDASFVPGNLLEDPPARSPQLPKTLEDELTPDQLKDVPQKDLEDALTPDNLK